jgi:16S rRNA (cytidine1402-2'-O)-methyltransferase
MNKPMLILLPNLIGDQRHHEPFLPGSVDKAVATLDGLIAESDPAGRRYLGRFETKAPAHQIPIAVFNGDTPDGDIDFLLEPIRKGERWGYVTDSGLPCIADPGSRLVRRARQSGVPIQAFTGPSSILLALMLSGLQGQRFTFHGYLDKDEKKRGAQMKMLEKRAQSEDATQLFMEAPYRNQHVLETALATLDDNTWFAAAWDLTLPTQGVVSQPVALWKKSPLPNLHKHNAIFLIGS